MNPKEIESIISYLEDTDTECMDLDMVLGWLRKLENAVSPPDPDLPW